MPQLPVISDKNLLSFLQSIGFVVVRINGSHHRLKHPDGRVSTVPIHRNQDLPKGLLRKISVKIWNLDWNNLLSFGTNINDNILLPAAKKKTKKQKT